MFAQPAVGSSAGQLACRLKGPLQVPHFRLHLPGSSLGIFSNHGIYRSVGAIPAQLSQGSHSTRFTVGGATEIIDKRPPELPSSAFSRFQPPSKANLDSGLQGGGGKGRGEGSKCPLVPPSLGSVTLGGQARGHR